MKAVLRNRLDPYPDQDFWPDPDSMNMDTKHCKKVRKIEDGTFRQIKSLFKVTQDPDKPVAIIKDFAA